MCVSDSGNNPSTVPPPPTTPRTRVGSKSLDRRAVVDDSLSGSYPEIRKFVASVYNTEEQVREYSDLICAAGVTKLKDLTPSLTVTHFERDFHLSSFVARKLYYRLQELQR